MREILFRGQTRKKGEKVRMDGTPVESNWVYGHGVLQGKGDHSIIYTDAPVDKFPVYTDTLGQYTGLTDRNGKKIFEGDTVRCAVLAHTGEFTPFVGMVAFTEGGFTVNDFFLSTWLYDGSNGNTQLEEMEIIGNIHDNPEMMGGGRE